MPKLVSIRPTYKILTSNYLSRTLLFFASYADFSQKNFFYDHIMDVTDFYNKGVKTPIGNEYTIAPHNVLWPIALNAISTNVQGHINQTPGYAGSENNIEPLDIDFSK